jgi:hypothetical protein
MVRKAPHASAVVRGGRFGCTDEGYTGSPEEIREFMSGNI